MELCFNPTSAVSVGVRLSLKHILANFGDNQLLLLHDMI